MLAFGVLMTHLEGSLLIARTTNGFTHPADEKRSLEALSWIPPYRIEPSVPPAWLARVFWQLRRPAETTGTA